MNYNLICYILGRLVMAEALILMVPLVMAVWNEESSILAFAASMLVCLFVSGLLQLRGRRARDG